MKFYLRRAHDYAFIGTVDDGSSFEDIRREIKKAGRTCSIKENHETYAIILIF